MSALEYKHRRRDRVEHARVFVLGRMAHSAGGHNDPHRLQSLSRISLYERSQSPVTREGT
ncbi:hypothetical protein KIN20_026321 [Parelaphostrongylus tenuis]|uniref:Uncharacterized protein n=1 Tax=Parelaphostrongylus tenuis TaxID=148309 RepID=A0AAD5QV02_PARTN|nr:hypothetical protein KIN20_026321 [Parelaphostrongylus tenuis]